MVLSFPIPATPPGRPSPRRFASGRPPLIAPGPEPRGGVNLSPAFRLREPLGGKTAGGRSAAVETGRDGAAGFTMVELLVAMVLISMVTLAASMAMRLTINAWERGREEGETPQVVAALPVLLGNQLAALVEKAPVSTAKGKDALDFCGEERGLSFFTTHAPRGSVLQGLLRVSWVFDEESGELLIYQQRIGGKDDLKEEFNPLGNQWNEGGEPVGRVTGIGAFSVAYSKKTTFDLSDRDEWEKKWKCGKKPAWIMLSFNVTGSVTGTAAGDKPGKSVVRYFRPGLAGM